LKLSSLVFKIFHQDKSIEEKIRKISTTSKKKMPENKTPSDNLFKSVCCKPVVEAVKDIFLSLDQVMCSQITYLTEVFNSDELTSRLSATEQVYDLVSSSAICSLRKLIRSHCNGDCCDSAVKSIVANTASVVTLAFCIINNASISTVTEGSTSPSQLDLLLTNIITTYDTAVNAIVYAVCPKECDKKCDKKCDDDDDKECDHECDHECDDDDDECDEYEYDDDYEECSTCVKREKRPYPFNYVPENKPVPHAVMYADHDTEKGGEVKSHDEKKKVQASDDTSSSSFSDIIGLSNIKEQLTGTKIPNTSDFDSFFESKKETFELSKKHREPKKEREHREEKKEREHREEKKEREQREEKKEREQREEKKERKQVKSQRKSEKGWSFQNW
jgi:hypothetical protein